MVMETLKNTIEVLNNIYDYDAPARPFLILKLVWDLFKDGVLYTISLQWINDFIKLPILIPTESNSVIADHVFSPDLSFLPAENMTENETFISGFFNCFFLYFPVAPVQFIWLRRVIIDGPWAGLAATIGIIIGNLSFLALCLFGVRDVMNIWFGSEPLTYFLGIWLIFAVIFHITHKPLKIIRKYQKKELLMILFINFALVWTDQPGLYQFFGNLVFQPGVSPLDQNFGISYFFGITLGSIFWAPLIAYGFVQFGYFVPRITKFTYSAWIRSFNLFCLVGCISLALASLCYYGFDYLFASPLGFVPQDKVWDEINGILPLLKTETIDAPKGRLGEKSSYSSVDTDLSLFDRGSYAGGPFIELSIESLNYKKEYAWRSRFDRLSSRYLTRGVGLLANVLQEAIGIEPEAKEVKNFDGSDAFNGYGSVSNSDSNSDSNSNSDSDSDMENDSDDEEGLIERFIEDYTAEATSEDIDIPELPEEQMIQFSAFSEIAKYSFDLFSMFEAVEVDPLDQQLALDIKEKYSANWVYRFLIHMDISNFLKRQPHKHKLTSEDEIALFENRMALNEYYNTLRSYSNLDLDLDLDIDFLFCGPKSYVNRVYNQQFKGTLKIVERLFSIHLDDDQNIPKLPEWEQEQGSLWERDDNRDAAVLKFDQPLYKTINKNPLLHETIETIETSETTSPFLEEATPMPFFAGWDNEQRKFLITNRLLTRQDSPLLKNEKQVSFTTWPVSEETLKNFEIFSRLYRTRENSPPSTDDLFQYAEPLMEEEAVIYEKLPNIIQRIELKNPDKLSTSLAPIRGGILWPGNKPLKFKIAEKIATWLPKVDPKSNSKSNPTRKVKP